MFVYTAAKALIFALFMLTVSDAHGPLGCPPTVSIPLMLAAEHHDVDLIEASALLAAEHRGRKWNPREVGRFGPVGGEAGELSVWRGFAPLATYRCNPQARAAADTSLARRYDGMPGDCRYIRPDVRVMYKLDARGPDIIKLKRGCDDAADMSCILRRQVGRLEEVPAGKVDLFERRVNIEAGLIAWKYAQEETAARWGRRWLIDWRASIRCSNAAWMNPRRSRPQRASFARCVRSVRRVLKWESIMRGRPVRTQMTHGRQAGGSTPRLTRRR